ncbi:GIY-YIG nuclease family protein [Perlabentimonas gracilis]|uniref:GIY-YIG nuclease family protein n=1 Tax=Perlabentimonas gracilis TaxID=2715279 RepID=UPI00140DD97A|nr:GIY-YIG nuclease family protein [Perlabentimonas gracilis]NHB68121.1 GIY-YIG nuclease family protein [Perlabentimonas gracilis]NHB68122.1 GIY-YIG nuclease family protein [Perlabentimonas gracilis]
MAFTYILYSAQLDKHYVGASQDELEQRIRRHNAHHKGFTGRANDWVVLMYAEPFETFELALQREREIKSWKSRKRIESLYTKR